jgi:phage shock protein A
MNNEIQSSETKLNQLMAQRENQELSLMKLRYEIRELKFKIIKMKHDFAREEEIYKPQESQTPLPESIKKSRSKKIPKAA